MQGRVVRGLKYKDLRGLHGTSKQASQLAAGLAESLTIPVDDFTEDRTLDPQRFPLLDTLNLLPSSRRATRAADKQVDRALKFVVDHPTGRGWRSSLQQAPSWMTQQPWPWLHQPPGLAPTGTSSAGLAS